MLRENAALFCIDDTNYNQSVVAIQSFSSFHSCDILIACHEHHAERIQRYTKTLSNSVILIKFAQKVPEEFLLAKFLEQLVRHPYKTIAYFKSSIVFRAPVHALFNQDMGDNLISATKEYTFWNSPKALDFYKREDPKARGRISLYGMDYINAGVVCFNVEGLRQSPNTLSSAFSTMLDFKYYVEPSLSEYLTSLFLNKTKFIGRDLNNFGDKYLVNVKAYNKIIRGGHLFKESTVLNFSECPPWDREVKLNRRTLQYPVPEYCNYILGAENFLDKEFIHTTHRNAKKWESRLGLLPEAFYRYYGG